MNEQEQMQQVQQIAEEVYKSLQQDPEATIAQLDQMNQQDGSGSQLLAVVITNHEDVLPIVEKFKEAPVVQESIQLLQEGAQQPQATPAMRNGAKLNYLKSLKGNCPDGYEMTYMKAGGRVCPVCQKKKAAQAKAKKAEEGTKMSGISKAMAGIKAELMKCGKKIKKNEQPSGPLKEDKSIDREAMRRDSLDINGYKYPNDTMDKEEKGKWVKNSELPKGAKAYNNGKNRTHTWIPDRKFYPKQK